MLGRVVMLAGAAGVSDRWSGGALEWWSAGVVVAIERRGDASLMRATSD